MKVCGVVIRATVVVTLIVTWVGRHLYHANICGVFHGRYGGEQRAMLSHPGPCVRRGLRQP